MEKKMVSRDIVLPCLRSACEDCGGVSSRVAVACVRLGFGALGVPGVWVDCLRREP